MTDPYRMWSRRVAFGFASAGTAIVLLTSLPWTVESEPGTAVVIGRIAFAAWGLVPYVVIFFGYKLTSNPWAIGFAGAGALAAEIGIRASVFLWPQSSTQALGLLVSPIMIVLIYIPAGAAVGWLMGRLWQFELRAVRVTVVAVSAMIWGLAVLGLARPEYFPTAVYSRAQTQARLGEPRVVVGDGSFETTLVSKAAVAPWYVAAELDGSPGEEVAVFRHKAVEVLDPADFTIKARLRIDRGQRSWLGSSSRPTRIDGRVLIVQRGGGYQRTEVRTLEGELVWAYRPDRSPPPTALLPADLDGDGTVEFYGSASTVERLDGAGTPVWSRDASAFDLVLAPRTRIEPGWVVAHGYNGWAKVWDESGNLLGELEQFGEERPVAVVDRPDGRGLLLNGKDGNAVRVVSIDGNDLFHFPLEGLTVYSGLSVRFYANEDPHLVVVARARDVQRWRLLIWGARQDPIYDEVIASDGSLRVFKARRNDGAETLFLSRDDLHALRPLGSEA